jgi:hypothetical protein
MLLSVIAIATVLGGILLTTQAYNAQVAAANDQQITDQTSIATATTQTSASNSYTALPQDMFMGMGMGPGRHGRGPAGMGGYGFIEVSSEFETNVLNIAKADTDVQALLNGGYNVTRVMPIIRTVLGADGNVVTKATNATVLLQKDTTGRAFVSVDLQQSKVTQIVTLTKTVIEKP